MAGTYWSHSEIQFLLDNIELLTLKQIYEHFAPHRSRLSVDLKIKRMRLKPNKCVNTERVPRNLVLEMLTHRIGEPRNFQPQRDFFRRVEIGQKRFWQLYRGEVNLTEPEYQRLTQEWNVSLRDAFELRQLELNL